MKPPKSLGIIGSGKNPCARAEAKKLAAFLKKRGVKFVFDGELLPQGKKLGAFRVDVAIALGGDGTLLRACRELKHGTPVLGVNCGRHGNLMRVPREKMLSAAEKLLAGKYKIEKRARILPVVNGRKHALALNEVELVTGKFGHIMEYELRVNGKLKLKDRADGVIVSTPTGSTAHAYSAGGKKINPKHGVFEVVPINSMLNRGKVFVVGNGAKITLAKFTKGCEVIIDGKVRVPARGSVLLRRGEPALLLRA
ncbi:MAG: NAD(+)/NADH kinase [Candidatus Diapherotrites archaeon]